MNKQELNKLVDLVGYLIDSALLNYENENSGPELDEDVNYLKFRSTNLNYGIQLMSEFLISNKLKIRKFNSNNVTYFYKNWEGRPIHSIYKLIEIELVDESGDYVEVNLDKSMNFILSKSNSPIILYESDEFIKKSKPHSGLGSVSIERYIYDNLK